MHPVILYIQNKEGVQVNDPIKTKLNFTPELNTIIYHKGIKSTVTKIVIDITPEIPAIVIYSQII